jgi:hypothetical protein
MAYVTAQLNLAVPRMGGGQALWMYYGEDIHTDVDAANFFTDGADKGMKVNDVVIVTKTTATIGATVHVVTEVSADGATISPAILA